MKDEVLHIRRYELSDKEAVRRLHNEALSEVGAHLGEGPWDDDLDRIPASYLEDGGEFLIGAHEEKLVALRAIFKSSQKEAEVKRMRVAPEFQGCGFGQLMLTALEEQAAELGYETLHLDTTVQQWAVQRPYLKNGYTESGRGTVGPFDCIYYEKTLLAEEKRV